MKVYFTYAGWVAEGPHGETYGPFKTRDEARSVRRAAVNAPTVTSRTSTIDLPNARTYQMHVVRAPVRLTLWQRFMKWVSQ